MEEPVCIISHLTSPLRYDYEEVDAKGAGEMMKHLLELQKTLQKGSTLEGFTIDTADEFSYTDPVDGSVSARQVSLATD
jgi:phosphoglucomutase